MHKIMLAIVTLLSAHLGGCVIIPYEPSAESKQVQAEISAPEEILVSAGARTFLGKFGDALKKADNRIEIIDPVNFRDLAFPEGDWTLARLLQPDSRDHSGLNNIHYLVIIGPVNNSKKDEFGEFIVHIGFYGYASQTQSVRQSALLFDIGKYQPLEIVHVKSEGTGRRAGLFYGLIIEPMTETSVFNELVACTSRRLTELKPAGPLRVAVMIAEPKDPKRDPFPPPD